MGGRKRESEREKKRGQHTDLERKREIILVLWEEFSSRNDTGQSDGQKERKEKSIHACIRICLHVHKYALAHTHTDIDTDTTSLTHECESLVTVCHGR